MSRERTIEHISGACETYSCISSYLEDREEHKGIVICFVRQGVGYNPRPIRIKKIDINWLPNHLDLLLLHSGGDEDITKKGGRDPHLTSSGRWKCNAKPFVRKMHGKPAHNDLHLTSSIRLIRLSQPDGNLSVSNIVLPIVYKEPLSRREGGSR